MMHLLALVGGNHPPTNINQIRQAIATSQTTSNISERAEFSIQLEDATPTTLERVQTLTAEAHQQQFKLADVFIHIPQLDLSTKASVTPLSTVPQHIFQLDFRIGTFTVNTVREWIKRRQLTQERVAIHFNASPSTTLTTEAAVELIHQLESQTSKWLISDYDAVLTTAIVQHSIRPLIYTPTIDALDSNVGSVLLTLDRLFSLVAKSPQPLASRIQLLLPSSAATTSITCAHQHFQSLHRRLVYQLEKTKSESTHLVSNGTDSMDTTIDNPSNASSTIVPPSALTTAAHPPQHANPALFHRAAIAPSTMFYRIGIRFASAIPSATASASASSSSSVTIDLNLGEVYLLLQDALRSFLGAVGLGKTAFQILDWNERTQVGIISASAEMSVGVRAALMMMGSWKEKPCRIEVRQQSVFLMALAD